VGASRSGSKGGRPEGRNRTLHCSWEDIINGPSPGGMAVWREDVLKLKVKGCVLGTKMVKWRFHGEKRQKITNEEMVWGGGRPREQKPTRNEGGEHREMFQVAAQIDTCELLSQKSNEKLNVGDNDPLRSNFV